MAKFSCKALSFALLIINKNILCVEKYSLYEVKVTASTSKGKGVKATRNVITYEDSKSYFIEEFERTYFLSNNVRYYSEFHYCVLCSQLYCLLR